MSEVLAKRQAELDARAASLPAPSEGDVIARQSQLLMRIKRVFSL